MKITKAVINKKNILKNLENVKKAAPGCSVAAIIKANAYGHGIIESGKLLESEVDFLGVAFVEEAEALREAGIAAPIIVLVPGFDDEIPLIVDLDLRPAVSSLNYIRKLDERARAAGKIVKAHLYINTGMNRDGLHWTDAVQFKSNCSKMRNVEFEGACTHFATAPSDPDFVSTQLERFNSAIASLKKAGYEFKYLHAANSAAILNRKDAHFNLIRPGLSLYGYPPVQPDGREFDFAPAMTLKTRVVQTRRIEKGESAGYDRLYIADRPTGIATLPIGYGDGYFKTLTGKAECLIAGKKYKIVGSVCMDECMVDVGDDPIKPGDEAILIGSQNGASITADEIAEKIGTITYEVLTAVSNRVSRVYAEE